jgi:hypothetical protein
MTRQAQNLSDPADDAKAVTPSDGADLPDGEARSLYIGGTGNVEVVTRAGTTVTFHNAASGTVLPVRVVRVRAAGTTATNIRALY